MATHRHHQCVLASTTLAVGLVSGLCMGPPPGSALAQDALGSGRALDANLDPRTGGRNAASPQERFAQGNLIVTDNVIGGRGFRGTVGYGAVGAFREDLEVQAFGEGVGSDDLYDFRQNAAISDPRVGDFGKTYERFRFGQDLALLEYRRVGQSSSAAALEEGLFMRPSELTQARMRLDRLAQGASTTASSERAAEPTILGGRMRDGTNMVLRASPFAGITETPINEVGQLRGLSTFDLARLRQDARGGYEEGIATLTQPFEARYVDLAPGLAPPLTPTGSETAAGTGAERLDQVAIGEAPRSSLEAPVDAGARRPGDTTGETELAAIQEEIAERFTGIVQRGSGQTPVLSEQMLAELEADLRALRERLAGGAARPTALEQGMQSDDTGQPEDTRIPPITDDPRVAGQDPVLPGTSGLDPRLAGDQSLPLPPIPELRRPLEEYGLILKHGQRVESLSSGEDDRFNELLASGEAALREGKYFWAERRFDRALRFIPGHPMATAGLANTQIAAGLYLSAAITLRGLFTFQPEMIDVRYEEGLLPNRPRMLDAVGTLEARIRKQKDRSPAAFVLAYLGHQLGERRYIARGLAIMGEDVPDDDLLPLLREVWLADGE